MYKLATLLVALSFLMLSGCNRIDNVELRKGMTYDEVMTTLGEPDAETELLLGVGQVRRECTYQRSNGQSARLVFLNERLSSFPTDIKTDDEPSADTRTPLLSIMLAFCSWPIVTLFLVLAYTFQRSKETNSDSSLAGLSLWYHAAMAGILLVTLHLMLLGGCGLVNMVFEHEFPIRTIYLIAWPLTSAPAAIGLVVWIMQLDDVAEGLAVFFLLVIFMAVPGFLTALFI